MSRSAATMTFGALAVAAASAVAHADVVPYTEMFATGNANWGTGGDWNTFVPLAWTGPGPGNGPVPGAGFVAATQNFVDVSPGPFPFTLFRGQDNFNSSNGAFEGNWIGNVVEFSFWVRHDAPEDLLYFVRLTPVGVNSPSMNYEFVDQLVSPNTWTKLSVEITEGTPGWVVGGGPGTYNAVFGNLGKIQIGIQPAPLAGINQDFNFDLSMVSIPAPGALALLGLAAAAPRRRRR